VEEVVRVAFERHSITGSSVFVMQNIASLISTTIAILEEVVLVASEQHGNQAGPPVHAVHDRGTFDFGSCALNHGKLIR